MQEVLTCAAVEVPLEARGAVFLAEFADVLGHNKFNVDRDDWIGQAVSEKLTRTMPTRVSKQLDRMRTRHAVLFQTLLGKRQTFAWEPVAGVSELTRVLYRVSLWSPSGYSSRRRLEETADGSGSQVDGGVFRAWAFGGRVSLHAL